jgi:hypothetical protein
VEPSASPTAQALGACGSVNCTTPVAELPLAASCSSLSVIGEAVSSPEFGALLALGCNDTVLTTRSPVVNDVNAGRFVGRVATAIAGATARPEITDDSNIARQPQSTKFILRPVPAFTECPAIAHPGP